MPEVLSALVAFVAEHRRCGVLNSGVENGCRGVSVGAKLAQPIQPADSPDPVR
jgi:hypothetical protein